MWSGDTAALFEVSCNGRFTQKFCGFWLANRKFIVSLITQQLCVFVRSELFLSLLQVPPSAPPPPVVVKPAIKTSLPSKYVSESFIVIQVVKCHM